jgi:hypothetical protein
VVVRQQPRRRRRRWFIAAGVVFLLLISIGSVVRFYTDLLWFQEVRFGAVFWRMMWSRLAVGVVGGVVAGAVLYVNLEVARRAAPRYRFVTPAGDVAERYRSMFQPYAAWANLGLAAFVGFLTGASVSTQWEKFQLWRHAQPFAVRDALFGRDASFYVFSLPFQRVVLSWLFGMVTVSILLGLLAHLLNGSIEPEANRVTVRPIVKVHLSVLFGVIALLKAYGYRLAQFDLVFSPRGVVTGASYTDVHAQLPALRLLVVIAIVAAVIFFLNFRFRGWLLPGAAIGLWVFSSVVIGALIPFLVQRFRVVPNESQRERPYIAKNIAATRYAFGLERLVLKEFPANFTLDDAKLADNRATLDNVRLWDPEQLKTSFQRLQAIRTYYEFHDVDIDRYQIGDQTRQIMLSPREVEPENLELKNWINTRLTYTHGYGIVATATNAATPEGEPDLLVRDLPPQGPSELVPSRAGVYYGEGMTGYSIVRTTHEENDYPVGEKQHKTTYAGKGGVELSNALRRMAFGWRFGDANLMISNFITKQSRIIMRRDIVERARTAAPFLRYDHDPYIVSVDGKLVWILDAYTATDRYPYSQEVELADIFPGLHAGRVNYIRNSIKVVMDAYDGTMTFYVVDPGDAIAASYQSIFPQLFKPGKDMPASIQAHLRYPEDLFTLQAWQYRLYHVTDPDRVYSREDVWDFPFDPVESTETVKFRMAPYYLYMKLPDETKAEFLLMLPFTPSKKPNLNGWVAARSDPEHYGQLIGFQFPRGTFIGGPETISTRINQDPAFSQQKSLWNQSGSKVQEGNLLVIPIGTSLIYVQPIYLKAETSPIPELKRVVVVYGDQIGFEPTLEAALAKALSGQPSTVTPVEGTPAPAATPPPAAPGGNVASLLDQAADHFAKADAALRAGDLATYQRENQAAREAIEEARRRSKS